ncbi:hypothetical protein MRB53_000492 [Persea americana]|uniref:Uncharacterized protein n=1 Tax=Persea americana TaxID=3435 RepID=A0ACC2MP09_PERAE|nr:hypothetical protein MRB53_000492 [Persea americana]
MFEMPLRYERSMTLARRKEASDDSRETPPPPPPRKPPATAATIFPGLPFDLEHFTLPYTVMQTNIEGRKRTL